MALLARTPAAQRRRHARLSVRQALVLGLIQGPAEVLPVSSSGHLVLVPALAVDLRGVRLGRGGGWYDRSLPLARSRTALLGLVRDEEVVEIAAPFGRIAPDQGEVLRGEDDRPQDAEHVAGPSDG